MSLLQDGFAGFVPEQCPDILDLYGPDECHQNRIFSPGSTGLERIIGSVFDHLLANYSSVIMTITYFVTDDVILIYHVSCTLSSEFGNFQSVIVQKCLQFSN